VEHICDALSCLGHDVLRLPAGPGFVDAVRQERPDIVFNIAEGEGGRCREAHVPAVLEMLSVPYVGSDPLTLCVTLDKPVAKRLVAQGGFATPAFRTFRSVAEVEPLPFPFPVIVKPAFEGAAGLDDVREQVRFVTETYGQEALVEEFVPGAEVTVGVLGNDPPRLAGMMEISPKTVAPSDFVYSLEVKRDWENQVVYRVPPALPATVLSMIEQCALGVYRLLGCRDFARIDFRIDGDGTPQFIECNPLPGLSPGYGDLPILAERMGTPYLSLVGGILSDALLRLRTVPA
jgi:D-alanine-D-alanine ligase